jgi:hypothetical protein
MPALVAARFNPDMKAKYTHLIDTGKPAKVALTAIMRKLVVLANALLERSEVRLNRGDSRIRRVLIQPAGWMEASRNGQTLLSGFARPCD